MSIRFAAFPAHCPRTCTHGVARRCYCAAFDRGVGSLNCMLLTTVRSNGSACRQVQGSWPISCSSPTHTQQHASHAANHSTHPASTTWSSSGSSTPLSTSCSSPPVSACSSICPINGASPATTRRELLQGSFLLLAALGGLFPLPLLAPSPVEAVVIKCPGLSGYTLRQCLREIRTRREGAGEGADTKEEKMKNRQYEQPGELVTLPSGIQYREMEEGRGTAAQLGAECEITYIVYRLASGAYFKYSSGGTPVLLFALGYGFEGQDDLGSVYRFRLGAPNSLPAAATPAMIGMKAGGRRRILVPPQLGWTGDQVGPIPVTFGGKRRLASHNEEPLLLEVQLQKVYLPDATVRTYQTAPAQADGSPRGQPFQLPAPPSPFKNKLGDAS